jgi:hypothetical protein
MNDVYVLWWQYRDKSSAGVLRAYADRQRAQEDLDLIEDTGDKQYFIESLPVYYKGTLSTRP